MRPRDPISWFPTCKRWRIVGKQIARKADIPADSLLRADAGLSHVLLTATGEGHCALRVVALEEEAGKTAPAR